MLLFLLSIFRRFSLLFGLRLLFSSRRPVRWIFPFYIRGVVAPISAKRSDAAGRSSDPRNTWKPTAQSGKFLFTLPYFTILSCASFGGYLPGTRPCATQLFQSTVSAETYVNRKGNTRRLPILFERSNRWKLHAWPQCKWIGKRSSVWWQQIRRWKRDGKNGRHEIDIKFIQRCWWNLRQVFTYVCKKTASNWGQSGTVNTKQQQHQHALILLQLSRTVWMSEVFVVV